MPRLTQSNNGSGGRRESEPEDCCVIYQELCCDPDTNIQTVTAQINHIPSSFSPQDAGNLYKINCVLIDYLYKY